MSGRGQRRQRAEDDRRAHVAAVREERRIAAGLDELPAMRRGASLLHDADPPPHDRPDLADLLEDVAIVVYVDGRRVV